MLATSLFSAIVILLSLREYRRRNGHHTGFLQSIDLRTQLRRLTLGLWDCSGCNAACERNLETAAAHNEDDGSEPSVTARAGRTKTTGDLDTRRVAYYKPTRGTASPSIRLVTTPTQTSRRSWSPFRPQRLQFGQTNTNESPRSDLPTPTPHLLPPFSFNTPPPRDQKPLPAFSFSNITVPDSPSLAPTTGETLFPLPPGAQSYHQHQRSPSSNVPDTVESTWSPSFAVRSENARVSNGMAEGGPVQGDLSPNPQFTSATPWRGGSVRVAKRGMRSGAGETMRRVVASFGRGQRVKLDHGRNDGRGGSSSETEVQHADMQYTTNMVGSSPLPSGPPVSPASWMTPLHTPTRGSNALPASGPDCKAHDDTMDATSHAPPTPSPTLVPSRHNRRTLKGRVSRVGLALGFRINSSPSDDDAPKFEMLQQSPSPQVAVSKHGDMDGSKAKTSLWKFGAGRKRVRERQSGVFEVKKMGVVRCDSLQQRPEMVDMAAREGENEWVGGRRGNTKRVRVR